MNQPVSVVIIFASNEALLWQNSEVIDICKAKLVLDDWASGDVGMSVRVEVCRLLDGFPGKLMLPKLVKPSAY